MQDPAMWGSSSRTRRWSDPEVVKNNLLKGHPNTGMAMSRWDHSMQSKPSTATQMHTGYEKKGALVSNQRCDCNVQSLLNKSVDSARQCERVSSTIANPNNSMDTYRRLQVTKNVCSLLWTLKVHESAESMVQSNAGALTSHFRRYTASCDLEFRGQSVLTSKGSNLRIYQIED